MGLFDFLKRHKGEEKVTYDGITFWAPKPISNEEYQKKREAEVVWLESHYDLNSAKGIMSIPERADLPRPTFGDGGGFRSYTGDVDYYLRRKSGEYEEAGNIELAILCLRKSNAIRMTSRRGYRKDDYYRLVRLLAQNGYVKEAEAEKQKIDRFFGEEDVDLFPCWRDEAVNRLLSGLKDCGTDLAIMQPHGCACPECAKYQGRVFSVSGADRRFPRIPQEFFKYGGIHKGCGHSFFPFIYGVNDPQLDYTFSIQKIKKWKYRRDIIAFSNRPFVDDRPQEDIDAALELMEKNRIAAEKKKYADDHMIEAEALRGEMKREFKWIQDNLPDICPKSFSGYMRMKNSNSKNYQKIVAAATQKGRQLK